MSLINDVLRDVDARRVQGKARTIGDETMIVPPARRLRWPPGWRLLLMVGATLLALLIMLLVAVQRSDREMSAPERALEDSRDTSRLNQQVVVPALAAPSPQVAKFNAPPSGSIASVDPVTALSSEQVPDQPAEPQAENVLAASSQASVEATTPQRQAEPVKQVPDTAARVPEEPLQAMTSPPSAADVVQPSHAASDVVARSSIQPSNARAAGSAAEHHTQALRAIERGAQADGERSLRRALDVDPGHVPANTTLAAILLQQGRMRELSELLDGLAARDLLTPRLVAVHARLLVEGDNEAAAIDILARVPLAAHDTEGLALLGSLRQRAGQHALAVEALATALSRNQLNGPAWAGMAVSLEALGRRGEALQAWQRALAAGGLQPALMDYAEARSNTLAQEGR